VLAETSLGRFWADLPVPAETPRAEIDAAGL
jgi:hypothetical protein